MAEKKVIQLEDRVPKLKAQRRHKTNRRFIIYITLFFILIMAVVYFESPISNVRQIRVNGNQYITEQKIEKASGVTTNSKMWDIDEKAVAAKIKKLPTIKTAHVDSRFPAKVVIDVTEYQRIAYLKKDKSFEPILANGKFMPMGGNGDVPIDAPVLIGFDQGKRLTQLADQLTQCDPTIIHAISEIVDTPDKNFPDTVTMYMNNGNKVLVSIGSLAKKMKIFYPGIIASLKKDQKGIIDLRVDAQWNPYPSGKGETNEKK